MITTMKLRRHLKAQALGMVFVAGLLAIGLGYGCGSEKTDGKTAQIAAQKEKPNRAPAKREPAENAKPAASDDLSAWSIIEMTDWLFWPFVALTGAGLLLLVYTSLTEYRENARSRVILQEKINVADLRRLVHLVQRAEPNRASRLLHQMISTFNKTNRAEPIGDDADQYLKAERDSFETFNRVLGFLSDTAGALGLLGTVWGIFQTFHGGKLDGPTILQGMSISLVTTLVGLIISLVLNMGATAVFAVFNRHLNTLATRAEELRQALLVLENKQKEPARPVAPSSAPAMQPTPPSPQPARRDQPRHQRSPEPPPVFASAAPTPTPQPQAAPRFAGPQARARRQPAGRDPQYASSEPPRPRSAEPAPHHVQPPAFEPRPAPMDAAPAPRHASAREMDHRYPPRPPRGQAAEQAPAFGQAGQQHRTQPLDDLFETPDIVLQDEGNGFI